MGNFIADSVKGNKLYEYPKGICNGIRLHRQIDEFTDSHPIVTQSKARLRPVYGKYSGVIIDLYYDHFLAAGWEVYCNESLEQFTEKCYIQLDLLQSFFSEESKTIFYYMRKYNWLLSYREIEGISKALSGLARRTTFISHMEKAGIELRKDYLLYQEEFHRFFPELQTFASGTLRRLNGAL